MNQFKGVRFWYIGEESGQDSLFLDEKYKRDLQSSRAWLTMMDSVPRFQLQGRKFETEVT